MIRSKYAIYRNNSMLLIIIILFVALLVRLHGINFGFPYLRDPDEPLFVKRSLQMLDQSTLNPNWFGVPASTTMYLLSVTYLLIFAVGWLMGDYQTLPGFLQTYSNDPTIFYLSGRIGIVFFAILSVLLVYLIGCRLFDKRAGLVAALLLAVNPIHVEVSRLIRPDIQMTFFILLVFWFSLNILKERRTRDYALSGFFLGMAIMSKYPAAVAVSMIFLAHIMVTTNLCRIRSHYKLIASGFSCIFGIFVSSPLFFLSPGLVYGGLLHESRSTHLSGTGEGWLLDAIFYVRLIITNELMIGAIFLIIGLILLTKLRTMQVVNLVVFPILFIVAISFLSLRWHRWLIPSIPFLILITAYGFIATIDYLKKFLTSYTQILVTIGLLLIAFFPSFYVVVSVGNELVGPDTRDIARDWMFENLPAKTHILIEGYAPEISFHYYNFYENSLKILERDGTDKFSVDWAEGWHIGKMDVNQVLKSEVEYFILTSVYQRYLLEAEQYPAEIETYETLLEHGELIYSIDPIPGYRSGPPIYIYKLIN